MTKRIFTQFSLALFLLLSLSFSSCKGIYFNVPNVEYLGESREAVDSLEVFYDEADVKRNFRTMGQMVHDKFLNYSAERIQSEMIYIGKRKGGDAIIFYDMWMDRSNEEVGDRLCIRAKLIKYVN
ncbi:MAG: hypothetical protein R8P61_06555 [Bacteroidia bacterium]|nr:hypothetical protein [Bacteroidia bacterium]